MRNAILCIFFVFILAVPAGALEITPPEVPKAGQNAMPDNTDNFGEGLLELLSKGVALLIPELEDAAGDCGGILATAMVCALLPQLVPRVQSAATLAGTAGITALLLKPTGTIITCAADTLRQICEYGKLLCPVMTTALAAQGGVTAATALYTGTIAFLSLLNMLVSKAMLPMVAMFLTFSVGYSAMGEELLKKLADAVMHFMAWLLKTVLIVFTTYMSITGVVSGTTDAAAKKAAKVAISSAVPVVGGILSDASESVLVSLGVLKNAAGIYGILAVLALLTEPFVKVGVRYLMLKFTALVCGILGDKPVSGLLEDVSSAMGLLLGMIAAGSVMVLISTVCFLKGISP